MNGSQRGIHLVVFDSSKGQVIEAQTYDTWENQDEAIALHVKLAHL